MSARSSRSAAPPACSGAMYPGVPTIHHQELAKRAHHHVLRFEVAMDDAARVRECDRFADPLEEAQCISRRFELPGVLVEPTALHPLHHVKQATVRKPPQVMNRDDARMLQMSEDSGLGRKAID